MTPRGVNFDPRDPLARALRNLPEPRAPRTLAPRVMALVHARLAQPPARTWFDWPMVWRVSSLSAAVAVMAAAVVGWPFLLEWMRPVVDGVVVRATPIVDGIDAAWALGDVVYRAVWHPVATPFVLFVSAMTIACATVGAMLSRVALGGASR